MFDKLSKAQLPIVLFLVGATIFLASMFDIEDITKLQMKRTIAIGWIPFWVGVILMLAGTGTHFFDELSGSRITKRRVSKTSDGFQVDISGTRVAVHFGKLEDFPIANGDLAVVLPANEFFDDECVRDERSALGAYLKKNFPTQIPEIQQLIFRQAESFPTSDVEKEVGVFAKSYGAGRCVFIDKPLNSGHRLIVAAVTTKRARVGLKCEIAFILSVVNELHRIVADKRLRGLVVPLIGSGHGGLRGEMALFSLVLAFSEVIARDSGHHLRSVDIVVFKPGISKTSRLKPSTVKRILGSASAMLD
jgi:hypothetical protein